MQNIKQFIKKCISQSLQDQTATEPLDLSKFVINTARINSPIKIYYDKKIHEMSLRVKLIPKLQHPKYKILLKIQENNKNISAFIYDSPIITSIEIAFLNYGFFEQNDEIFTFYSNKINDQTSINIQNDILATKNFPYINQDIHLNISSNLSNNATKQNGYDTVLFPYGIPANPKQSLPNISINYVKFFGKNSIERQFSNTEDLISLTKCQPPFTGKYNNNDIYTEKFNFQPEDFNSLEDFIKNQNIKLKTNTGETFVSTGLSDTSNDTGFIKFKNIE